jgi:hypothetical protein
LLQKRWGESVLMYNSWSCCSHFFLRQWEIYTFMYSIFAWVAPVCCFLKLHSYWAYMDHVIFQLASQIIESRGFHFSLFVLFFPLYSLISFSCLLFTTCFHHTNLFIYFVIINYEATWDFFFTNAIIACNNCSTCIYVDVHYFV